MAITDKKIGSWTNPVVNEADQPQRTAAEMKAIFDANSNQIKAAFNAVIDELVGTGGAGNVGNGALGEIPAGTVAAQLAALLNMFGSYPSSSDIKGIRLSADNEIEVTLDGTTWQPTVQTGDPVTDLGALPVAADIQDTDGFLMYDESEMKNKRTLWSKIKSVLGNVFAAAGHTHGSITSDGKFQDAIWEDGDGSYLPMFAVDGSGYINTTTMGQFAVMLASTGVFSPSKNSPEPVNGAVEIAVVDNSEYRIASPITSLTITSPYTNGETFECWIRFKSGASITVTFPSGTSFIGGAPTFEASKTYEMSIKDGSVICAEVTTE